MIDTGETQEQGGQAGGMSICISEYCSDPRLILGYHVIPGKWLLQGGTTGGGGALKWFERQFGYEERLEAEKEGCSSFELLSRLGATVDAGSDGEIFCPTWRENDPPFGMKTPKRFSMDWIIRKRKPIWCVR